MAWSNSILTMRAFQSFADYSKMASNLTCMHPHQYVHAATSNLPFLLVCIYADAYLMQIYILNLFIMLMLSKFIERYA